MVWLTRRVVFFWRVSDAPTCPPKGSGAPTTSIEVQRQHVGRFAKADPASAPCGRDDRALRQGRISGREHRAGELQGGRFERDLLRAVRGQGRLLDGRLSGWQS